MQTNKYLTKNYLVSFPKRLTLFSTISKSFPLLRRLNILFTGNICYCKFCFKYFLRMKPGTNFIICDVCWQRRVLKKCKERQCGKVI